MYGFFFLDGRPLSGIFALFVPLNSICRILYTFTRKCDASAQASEHFSVRWSSGGSSLAEAGLQRTKLTHDETTAHKIKSLFGIRNKMPRGLLLTDYYMRDLTS